MSERSRFLCSMKIRFPSVKKYEVEGEGGGEGGSQFLSKRRPGAQIYRASSELIQCDSEAVKI